MKPTALFAFAVMVAGCVPTSIVRTFPVPLTEENIAIALSPAQKDFPYNEAEGAISVCRGKFARNIIINPSLSNGMLNGFEQLSCPYQMTQTPTGLQVCSEERTPVSIPIETIRGIKMSEKAIGWVMLLDPMPMPTGGCSEPIRTDWTPKQN